MEQARRRMPVFVIVMFLFGFLPSYHAWWFYLARGSLALACVIWIGLPMWRENPKTLYASIGAGIMCLAVVGMLTW